MNAEPRASVDTIEVYLGVSRDSIYGWIVRKVLPVHRVRSLWKYQRSEVDEWVRAGGFDENQNRSTEGLV